MGRSFPDRREPILGGYGKNILFFTLRERPPHPDPRATVSFGDNQAPSSPPLSHAMALPT
jgi:hypothetical protein